MNSVASMNLKSKNYENIKINIYATNECQCNIDIINDYIDNGERVCWIITRGKSIEFAKKSFNEAIQKLKIETEKIC